MEMLLKGNAVDGSERKCIRHCVASSFGIPSQVETFPPHLALVFGSQGLNKLLHAERSPHQNRDPLERSDKRSDLNTCQ